MKKIIIVTAFFSMFLIATPFAVQAQDMARVTLSIQSLKGISRDACGGKMGFYGNFKIGGAVKKFPGLNFFSRPQILIPVTQFSTTTRLDFITVSIEVWDDDDRFCGGGDDKVCVDGRSNVITKTFSTLENKNQNFTSVGTCNVSGTSGTEKGEIKYNITIEPTRTAYIKQGNWRIVKQETKTGTGNWEPLVPTLVQPPCASLDDYRVFRANGTYEINEGDSRCSPTDPQIKVTGNWIFQNNDSKLLLTQSGSSEAILYTVNWIDENSMILATAYPSGGVTTYNKITFKH
jgi:hypothetical protein